MLLHKRKKGASEPTKIVSCSLSELRKTLENKSGGNRRVRGIHYSAVGVFLATPQ